MPTWSDLNVVGNGICYVLLSFVRIGKCEFNQNAATPGLRLRAISPTSYFSMLSLNDKSLVID